MIEPFQDSDSSLAILYSFRRCPYAMRARMALKYSGISTHLREIDLKNKPQAMQECSVKGTVPILVLPNGTIIEESRDIMLWALHINDPEQWLPPKNNPTFTLLNNLLDDNDFAFKSQLDQYKYADRYPEQAAEYYRRQGEQFLTLLEQQLSNNRFLMGDKVTMADIGIFPFIRQFAFVDKDWFYQSPYPHLQTWLDHFLHHFLQSELFISVMEKHTLWVENSVPVVLASNRQK